MSRRTALVLLVAAAVVALPSAAWAHGQLRPGRAPGGTTVATVLVVPSEREGRTNSHIALALPPDFTPLSCGAPVGWTCSTTDKGFAWQRVTGLTPAEDFDLRMRVSERPGTYLFPLGQTYDDGETRTFAGAPGQRDEAPVFTVSGAAATSPSSGPGPSRSPAQAGHPSAAAGLPSPVAASAGSEMPAPNATTAPAASMPASGGGGSGGSGQVLSDLPAGRRLEPASSDGGSALLVGLGVVGGTALLGTVLLLRRRRTDDEA